MGTPLAVALAGCCAGGLREAVPCSSRRRTVAPPRTRRGSRARPPGCAVRTRPSRERCAGERPVCVLVEPRARPALQRVGERLGEVAHVGHREVESLGAGGRHDVPGVAGEEQSPVAQRLGHEAAQRRDRLLDRRTGHEPAGDLARQAGAELVPEAIVGPVFDAVVDAALHVVATEHRMPHRAQREAPLAVGVDELLVDRRRLGEDAEPAERVHPLVRAQHRRRDHRAAHTVGTVATGDVLALDAVGRTVVGERDVRRRAVDLVWHHVGRPVDHRHAGVVDRGVEVLRHLGLAVDHHALADVPAEVDAHMAAREAEAHAVVDGTEAVHARADPGLAQRLDRAPLEDAGTDPRKHVLTRLAFEDDRADAGEMEQPREQQPGRAAADDDDRHARRHVRGRSHASAFSRRSRVAIVGRHRATLADGSRPSRRAATNSRSWSSTPATGAPALVRSTGVSRPSTSSS
jgi:hypothetical protein